MNKTQEDYEAGIANLQANIESFEAGNSYAYRPVSVELRKLLCDGNSTLLPRVFVNFSLHKLIWTKRFEQDPASRLNTVMMLPGRLRLGNQFARLTLRVSEPLELMPLEEWIKQPILSPKFTILELIKSVADKEGAHSDPKFNETLLQTRNIVFGDFASHVVVVVGIGQYLLEFLTTGKPPELDMPH